MSAAPVNHDALDYTTKIVVAFVGNNATDQSQISGLIASTYAALSTLGAVAEPKAPPQEPAVPIRASIKPDHVVCLECGTKAKMLKRHLTTAHGLTAEEYRKKWDLKPDHPLTAPNYSAVRTELAKKIGLGRKGATK